MRDTARYTALARQVDPAADLRVKPWWINWLSGSGTLSVIGPRLYIGADAGPLDEREIWHEARHIRQMRWCSFGIHPWIGWPIFAVLCLLPLPVLLSLRAVAEMDAEGYALARKVQTGSGRQWAHGELLAFAATLSRPGYLWALPRSLARPLAAWWARRFI